VAIYATPLDEWQLAELRKLTTEEAEYRISVWPDGSVTVDDGDTVILEFTEETIDDERYGKIAWSIYDVMSMLEDDEGNCPITVEQARDFLIRNEKYLQETTIEQGWTALHVYAEQDKLGT
jgi:hypothetical protein